MNRTRNVLDVNKIRVGDLILDHENEQNKTNGTFIAVWIIKDIIVKTSEYFRIPKATVKFRVLWKEPMTGYYSNEGEINLMGIEKWVTIIHIKE